MLILQLVHFVSGPVCLARLTREATVTLNSALRPKTRKCYHMLFKNVLAFCHCAKIAIPSVNLHHVMAYLQYLVENGVSVNMVANNISALKASFIIYQLNHSVFENPQIAYFIKALKINRPLKVVQRNVMTLSQLRALVTLCDTIHCGQVFKAAFLLAFFAFLRISNIAPHAAGAFDPSRNLTPSDIKVTRKFMNVAIKWSKTLQTRDKIHVVTVPKLSCPLLCPVTALQKAIAMYHPAPQDPLFQIKTSRGWVVLTDSRIRKVLSKLNVKMGLSPSHFTFHTFRRSGAFFAYNSHMPLGSIKQHGSWTSDCVWAYIQANKNSSRDIAASFAAIIDNA